MSSSPSGRSRRSPRLPSIHPALLAWLCFALAACTSSTTEPQEPGSLTVVPLSLNLPVGDSYIFEAVLDEEGSGQSVSWSVTAGSVSGSGSTVTYTAPTQPGTYTLTATAGAGRAASVGSATIVVEAPAAVVADGPTGPEMIDAALAAGTLDVSTATLYKAYWAYRDPRLPGQFAGPGGWAGHPPDEILNPPAGVSDAVRAELAPYALPPDAEGSWYQLLWPGTDVWSEPSASAAREHGGAPAAPPALGSAYAPNGDWDIGWDKRYPADSLRAESLVAELDFIYQRYASELGSAPTGTLHVYLVPLAYGVGGENVPYHPRGDEDGYCPALANFILINRNNTGTELRAAIAHEMLHAFQRAQSSPELCARIEWFREATAIWAETFFFPELVQPAARRADYLHSFLDDHASSVMGHWANSYPFFVYLHRKQGEGVIFDWIDDHWLLRFDGATDIALGDSYGEMFKEFALQSLGEPAYDQVSRWVGAEGTPSRVSEVAEMEGAVRREWFPSYVGIESGGFQYFELTLGDDAPKRIQVNNPVHVGLMAGQTIGVRLLYKRNGDSGWSFEDLIEEKTFCRDRAGEDYHRFIVVLSYTDERAQSDGHQELLTPFREPIFEGWSECEYEIKLEPVTITVRPGESAPFQVTLDPEHEGPLRYLFRTAGARGSLSDPASPSPSLAHAIASPFAGPSAVGGVGIVTCSVPGPGGPSCVETTSPSITFMANSDAPDGTQMIEVEVVDEAGESLGTATATVEVRRSYQVTISPQQATISEGEAAQFQAQLNPAYQSGGTLSYRWTTPGAHGSFNGQVQVESPSASASYVGQSEGSESVSVQVFATEGGTTRSLGTASANVTVEGQEPTVVSGGWTTITTGLANNRSCVVAFLTFPIVPGATSYSVHAHGFNDTFFYGTSIEETFTPPFPAYRECAGNFDATSGINGNQYFYYLSGYAGPDPGAAVAAFNSRFGGMIVDVTVGF